MFCKHDSNVSGTALSLSCSEMEPVLLLNHGGIESGVFEVHMCSRLLLSLSPLLFPNLQGECVLCCPTDVDVGLDHVSCIGQQNVGEHDSVNADISDI